MTYYRHRKCLLQTVYHCGIGAFLLTELCSNAYAIENVKMTGALIEQPCLIAPGDESIQLDFGTIIDKYLYLNKRTRGQEFQLHLSECDLSLGTTVSVAFRGTENRQLPGLLAIDSASKATGFAIGLETSEAQPLPVNKASSKYPLRAGHNIISLKAYVQGEPQALTNQRIELGPFSATATFSLEYE